MHDDEIFLVVNEPSDNKGCKPTTLQAILILLSPVVGCLIAWWISMQGY